MCVLFCVDFYWAITVTASTNSLFSLTNHFSPFSHLPLQLDKSMSYIDNFDSFVHILIANLHVHYMYSRRSQHSSEWALMVCVASDPPDQRRANCVDYASCHE